ncbi:MAG: hypothetical protein US60_C0056G0005 [Microgenomates group bacterium GW2011_GWC1_37_8]|uniref:Methyltransferase domain-containing protein n=1 Tax=Candidatus Zambryskibacteria bacterium RIFCSPHIGHO2_01_FULL_46_25 TaxID=1802738 RepID=A0A1G2T185_9BACT|nr:MAG: hypothetical protein US60_C0056G0005 [Microgenomates group bacterium GW2011_GWC1_37_8]OHA90391.1 MAG: hypothetical protein A2838_02220 [Candidatus Zambryskibacteria bacterium RIFCSPHIGHO2_01_FULL_46_25]OHB06928.1 MAG: hypothetical protein A3A31_01355 [Candidatus Zambryskibacteria bacterium RIFCSPLOWO2_01_FULL_48_25]
MNWRRKIIGIFQEFKSICEYFKYNFKQYRSNRLIGLAIRTGTDKANSGHGYVRIYDFFLNERRHTIKTLCEIGLLYIRHQTDETQIRKTTPSLNMWRQYLPNAKIIGFDICHFLPPTDSQIVIVQGDQSKREDLKKIIEIEKDLDVIIDDALHASKHQQITFNYLFKYLKSGGLFIIEDLHWQPSEYEDEKNPKTIDILREFKRTGLWLSTLASEEERRIIEEGIKNIFIFDSLNNPDITKSCDGIAVIEKR